MADRRMANKDTSINKGLLLTIGVAFLVQAGGFVWWMSGLNSEVTRLASIQGTAIPALEAEAQKCGIAIHPRVEIKDTNDRYVMIPKLADPHKLLREDTDDTASSWSDTDAGDDSLT